jgi:hypothetical protein
MGMWKTMGTCFVGGLMLGASAVTGVWWASHQPQGALARLFYAAEHTAQQCQPGEGFAPVLAKLEAAKREKAGELDLSEGLPEDPLPLDEPAPIVIPDVVMPRTHTVGFPEGTAAPVVPAGPGAPPAMHYVQDNVLPMPKAVEGEEEQEDACEADIRAMFKELVGEMLQQKADDALKSLGGPLPRTGK